MKPVPMSDWGKDHWAMLAYVETRCVDYKGNLNGEHMRCNPKTHPGLIAYRCDLSPPIKDNGDYKYPSMLKAGVPVVEGHDDWDCFYDLEEAKLIEDKGTGVNPRAMMTKEGLRLATELRRHKTNGGSFGNFEPDSNVAQPVSLP